MIGFFGLSLQTLSVTVAEDVFDQGERGFGLLLSFVGLGAVSMSPIIAGAAQRFRRSQLQQTALMLYAMGALVIAVAPVFAVALAGGFMMGAAHLTSASTLNTAIQLQVDESARAKVLAVYLSMLTASNPIGQLLLGQLIDRTDPRLRTGWPGERSSRSPASLQSAVDSKGSTPTPARSPRPMAGRSSRPCPPRPVGTDHQPAPSVVSSSSAR